MSQQNSSQKSAVGVKVVVKAAGVPVKPASNVAAFSDDVFGDLEKVLTQPEGEDDSDVILDEPSSEGEDETTGEASELTGDESIIEGESEPDADAESSDADDNVLSLDNMDLEGLGDDLDVDGSSDDSEGTDEEGAEGTEEDDGTEEIGIFRIYNKKCLRCTHLVPELTEEDKGKAFKNCHFSAGNESCPAKEACIVVGIPVEKIVKSIKEAQQSGDSERLAMLYSKLATKDEAQQSLVYQALKAKN